MPEIGSMHFGYRDDGKVPRFDDSKAVFVFDGVCVLCSGGASWLMRVDRRGQVALASAQSPLGRGLYAHYGLDIDESYLLVVDGRAYTASLGYLKLCTVLGGPWHALRIFGLIPERIRDWVYAAIARNRYRWFGKTDYCTLLTAEQRKRLISQ
jgi:predicted DCC family thiol-disulfide oxidoreductase YuxK